MEGRKITPFMKQCFATAAVGINVIGTGCAAGFPAILLPQLSEEDSSIPLTKEVESWIAAILALSIVAGNFLGSPVMDRFGRKVAHCVVTAFCIVGWVITILATSAQVLIVGRIFMGLASGQLNTLRSILIGEYTSPRNRGAFLTTVSLAQAFGIFFVHLIGSLLSWQKTAIVCMFYPLICLLMIIYTPESPSWLVTKGKYDECRTVFRWLRGLEEDQELEDMINARIALEQAATEENKFNWFARLIKIIRKREFFKPILIMIHSNVILQFSGATIMASFSTVIIELLMGPKANAHFWMVFLDTQRIIFNAVAIYVINKVRRRIMVSATGILSVASHFAIAIYVYCRITGWDYDAIWLPALLINLQIFAVAVGTVPMPQVLGGEVFPLEYKSIGVTISLTVRGATMFLALKTFPYSISSVGLHGTYTWYAGILLVNLVILLILLPETKGKTLQQIEDEFRGRPLKSKELERKKSLPNKDTTDEIMKP